MKVVLTDPLSGLVITSECVAVIAFLAIETVRVMLVALTVLPVIFTPPAEVSASSAPAQERIVMPMQMINARCDNLDARSRCWPRSRSSWSTPHPIRRRHSQGGMGGCASVSDHHRHHGEEEGHDHGEV